MANNDQIQSTTKNVEQKVDASKLSPEQKEQAKQGYLDWAKEKGHNIYEGWLPWIEDQYLSWFTKDNKASYATKQQLDKTKVTNIQPVNTLQDDVNKTVGDQFGKGGLLQPVGDAFSKEGVNRAERGGKDDKGGYLPDSMSGVENAGKSAAGGVSEGTKTGGGYLKGAGSSVYSGAKGAAGYVGGMFGGKKDAADASGETAAKGGDSQNAAPPQQQQTKSMIDQAEQESKPANTSAQKASQPATNAASQGAGAVQDGAKAGISSAGNAAKGIGGSVGGLFGGKKS